MKTIYVNLLIVYNRKDRCLNAASTAMLREKKMLLFVPNPNRDVTMILCFASSLKQQIALCCKWIWLVIR